MNKTQNSEKNQKILIVEDELAYRKLLHDELTENGYSVIEAKDGKEGIIMAKKYHPDLILLDIRMPDMNGVTVLEELRKDDYGSTAKVIFLTNLESDDQMIQKVIKDKPAYYLIKSDIQISDLLEKIKNLLGAH